MALLERMDDLVKRLGLYPGLSAPPRPRHMRWLPVVALVIAVAGFARHVTDPDAGPVSGFMLMQFAFILSLWFPIFGPLRNPSMEEPLDERETLLRMRASLAGARAVGLFAVVGCLLFAVAEPLGLWAPQTGHDWLMLFFALHVIFSAVPTLYASWATRPLPWDEE